MRLLETQADGSFRFVERFGRQIPRYAILSHTWGRDEDEVTYKDIVDGVGKQKAGYGKIVFCSKQAIHDGLHYIWIDTCCIDKSSSAELSEAIASMFRWYRRAVKCYVYLVDVSTSDFIRDIQHFRSSKWFTRGWTLQELIAPTSVQFFSHNSHLLGDKETLETHIAEVTGIPIKAFQGAPLSQFSLEDRMSWSGDRKTKREEDAAYCLLGIYDVYIPLIYGEGRQSAFHRLWEAIERSLHYQPSRPSSPKFFKGLSRRSTTLSFESAQAIETRKLDTSSANLSHSTTMRLEDSMIPADAANYIGKLPHRAKTWAPGAMGSKKKSDKRYYDTSRDIDRMFHQITSHATEMASEHVREAPGLLHDLSIDGTKFTTPDVSRDSVVNKGVPIPRQFLEGLRSAFKDSGALRGTGHMPDWMHPSTDLQTYLAGKNYDDYGDQS